MLQICDVFKDMTYVVKRISKKKKTQVFQYLFLCSLGYKHTLKATALGEECTTFWLAWTALIKEE